MVEEINYWLTDSEVLELIGTRIKEKRLKQNLSQEELANETGLSKITIRKLEQGQGSKLDTFIRVMRALGELEKLNKLISADDISPKERFLRREQKDRQRARKAKGN